MGVLSMVIPHHQTACHWQDGCELTLGELCSCGSLSSDMPETAPVSNWTVTVHALHHDWKSQYQTGSALKWQNPHQQCPQKPLPWQDFYPHCRSNHRGCTPHPLLSAPQLPELPEEHHSFVVVVSVLELELRTFTLNHSTSPFLWKVFFKIGSWQLFCPGWLQTSIFLISASRVARITDVGNWCPAWTQLLKDLQRKWGSFILWYGELLQNSLITATKGTVRLYYDIQFELNSQKTYE
jgi:hypothetical protein